jgi:hypothetical protein
MRKWVCPFVTLSKISCQTDFDLNLFEFKVKTQECGATDIVKRLNGGLMRVFKFYNYFGIEC